MVPELLLGVAVDVVARGSDSFASTLVGVGVRFSPPVIVAAVNVAVWVVESITDHATSLRWRGLTRAVEHTCAWGRTERVPDLFAGFTFALRRFKVRWRPSRPPVRRSSSCTGCRPCGTRTGSGCWPAAGWSSPAHDELVAAAGIDAGLWDVQIGEVVGAGGVAR